MKTLSLMATIVFFAICYTVNAENPASNSQSKKIIVMNDAQVKNDTLTVQGECGMCKTRIEKAAKSVKGVSSTSWDIKTKKLQVDFDPSKTTLEAISKAIAKVGHDTNKDKADQATYDALPACCKYR